MKTTTTSINDSAELVRGSGIPMGDPFAITRRGVTIVRGARVTVLPRPPDEDGGIEILQKYVPAALHQMQKRLQEVASKCLPLPQAASLLGVSTPLLERLARKGDVPCLRMAYPAAPRGEIWLLPWEYVDRLLALEAEVIRLSEEVDRMFEEDARDE